MAEFILVHGAWHGAWCWREVLPQLRARGHRVSAIDLPGHGEDRSPPETVTLADYVARIVHAVDASIQPPILVGHSMGVVSQAAEQIPDRIRAVVYVSGLLPPSGSSMMEMVGGFDPQYLAQIEWAPDRRTARISLAGLRDFFYSSCPAGVADAAFPLLTPQPVAPFETPFSIGGSAFTHVPAYYVETLRDRIMPVSSQRAMRVPLSFKHIYEINTDHAAFFSAPQELSDILNTVALDS